MMIEKIGQVDPVISCFISLNGEPLVNEFTVDLIYNNACIHIGPNATIFILFK